MEQKLSTTVVDNRFSGFQTLSGGRHQGAAAGAALIANRPGPGDRACLDDRADRRRTPPPAPLCPPRSLAPGVGVAAGSAEPRRVPKRGARGRRQWRDHPLEH